MCTLYPRYSSCCGIPVRIAMIFIAILSIVTGAIINAALKKAGVDVSSIKDVHMLRNLSKANFQFEETNHTLLSSREREDIDSYQDVVTTTRKRRSRARKTTREEPGYSTIEIIGDDGQTEIIRFLDDSAESSSHDSGSDESTTESTNEQTTPSTKQTTSFDSSEEITTTQTQQASQDSTTGQTDPGSQESTTRQTDPGSQESTTGQADPGSQESTTEEPSAERTDAPTSTESTPSTSTTPSTTTTTESWEERMKKKDPLARTVGYVTRNGVNFMAMVFVALGILLLVANFLNSPDLALLYVVLCLANDIAALVLLVGVVTECTKAPDLCMLSNLDWFSGFMVTIFWFLYIFVWAFFAAVTNSYANDGVGNTLA